jgi:hypothetical protein
MAPGADRIGSANMIEEFFKAHQHTIAAVAAAGTVGAVVTSLWLAWSAKRADRSRLKAHADIVLIFNSTIDDPKDAPRFVSVSVTNQCKWPLRIQANFFYWKTPFKREYMTAQPLDQIGSDWIPKKSYPREVAPRTSESFYMSDLPTLRRMRERFDTFADRLRFRFIKAYVQTDDGETFRVRLSPAIRQVLAGR